MTRYLDILIRKLRRANEIGDHWSVITLQQRIRAESAR